MKSDKFFFINWRCKKNITFEIWI